MLFEWDDRKNDSNRRKHGIGFDVAVAVIDDPMHVTTRDRFVDGEIRWRTVGQVGTSFLIVVAHTLVDEDEEIVRVISARQATSQERREYEEEP